MEYYLAIKRNELIHIMTKTNLKNMLSERHQTQEMTYCMISSIRNFQKRQMIYRDRKQIIEALGWKWEQELMVNGHREIFYRDRNVLRIDYGDVSVTF